jgi:hypothetical protein
MAWFTRFTRFGDMHFVYGQERNMNCGPACVLMCVLKINKLTPHQAAYLEDQVRKSYNKTTGESDSGDKAGTGPQGLVAVLNSLKCGMWTSEKLVPPAAPEKIIGAVGVSSAFSGPIIGVNPVIVAMDWDSGGAHWVVVDTVRALNGQHYATICDPWDANVHVEQLVVGKPFVYNARAENRLDLAGKHKEYQGGSASTFQITSGSKTSVGRLNMWPMIRRV